MGLYKWIASFAVLFSVVFGFGCGVKSPPVPYLTLDEDNPPEKLEVGQVGARDGLKKGESKSPMELKGLTEIKK